MQAPSIIKENVEFYENIRTLHRLGIILKADIQAYKEKNGIPGKI